MEIIKADGTTETRLTFNHIHINGDMLEVSFKEYPESSAVTTSHIFSANDLAAWCRAKFAEPQEVQ